MRRTVMFLAFCMVAAAPGVAAEKPAAGGGSHSLRMEELEVRGLRVKPSVLYLPVHRGITIPSPVRYDLFLEDMVRPVFPREVLPEAPRGDGIPRQGAFID